MKKEYIPLDQVRCFIDNQTELVSAKYHKLIDELEKNGYLVWPYAEKVDSDLFAIRIPGRNNIRVFYFYYIGNKVIGIYALEKKTRKLAKKDIKHAKKLIKQFNQN
jgi:phage-related protein